MCHTLSNYQQYYFTIKYVDHDKCNYKYNCKNKMLILLVIIIIRNPLSVIIINN